MPDFLPKTRGLTIGEIVALTRAEPLPASRSTAGISDVAPLDSARASDISFLDDAKYLDALATTRAGACLVSPRFAEGCARATGGAGDWHPYRAFVTWRARCFLSALRPSSLFGASGRRALRKCTSIRRALGSRRDRRSACGHRTGCRNRSGHADRGRRRHRPNRCDRPRLRIGPGATVAHALIGDRVIVHPGARIGQDGFGFLPSSAQGHVKIPQNRRVIIQDDVEIGANVTIDRGSTRDTVIGEGTKIDNLVQIAHNVSIGRHCLIAGQVGISGSARTRRLRHAGRQSRHRRSCHRRHRSESWRAKRRHARRSGRSPLDRLARAAGPGFHEGRGRGAATGTRQA